MRIMKKIKDILKNKGGERYKIIILYKKKNEVN